MTGALSRHYPGRVNAAPATEPRNAAAALTCPAVSWHSPSTAGAAGFLAGEGVRWGYADFGAANPHRTSSGHGPEAVMRVNLHGRSSSPRVGALTDDHTGNLICRYTSDERVPPCGAHATVHIHVLVRTPNGQQALTMLQACRTHAAIARLTGLLLAEHPFQGWCGRPWSYWDRQRNVCDLDELGRQP